MKLSEAEKMAAVLNGAKDQHNSETATIKIKLDLCAAASAEFSEFTFYLDTDGNVAVRKRMASTGSV